MPSPERTVADPEVPAGSAGGGPLKNAKALPQLPDFIAVGPPRTATTWLDLVLRGHVSLPGETKETHFFTRNYGRGIDWYARHFRRCVGGQVVGEICPSYFVSPQARERIRCHPWLQDHLHIARSSRPAVLLLQIDAAKRAN